MSMTTTPFLNEIAWFVVVFGSCMIYRRLWAYKHRLAEVELTYQLDVEEMRQHLARQVVIDNVLLSSLGGIKKRLSESLEIVETIQATAPDLFERCDGLLYWLHANDQFLVRLHDAARVDQWHEASRMAPMREDREEVFAQIYAAAGLPPPPHEKFQCLPTVNE